MKTRKKLTVWILGSIAVLLFLAGILILMGPRLLNSEYVKREIVNHLSRRAGGRVHFTYADFSFFPHPHVVIRNAGLSIPGTASADIPSVTVYPKVWSLLIGRVDIARITAQSPRITVDLPQPDGGGKAPPRTWTMEGLSTEAAGLPAPPLSGMEDLSLLVRDGKITFKRGRKTLLGVDRIRLLSESSSRLLAIELTGESAVCEDISLKIRMDTAARKAEGRIDLKGLRPRRLPASLIPGGPIKLGHDETGLELVFKADLNHGVKTDIQGSASPFTLVRGEKATVFRGARFKGTLERKSGSAAVSFSELHLDSPRLDLSGEMTMDSRTPRVRLRLEAKDVDVPSVRETALTLGGTIPDVRDIFDIVRGGEVPLITISSQADAAADLTDPAHLHIRGRILKGHVFVPETGMHLIDVKGDAAISKGVLIGTRLQARLGKASGHNGSLKLGLTGHNRPFHLDMAIQADLTEALPTVQGLIQDGPFERQLRRIEHIQGNAAARLILAGTTESMTVRVEASEFDLTTRYRGMPYLLQARGGRLSYESGSLKAHDMAVNIGRSSIARLSGMLDWQGKAPFLEMEGGATAVLLKEIFPWLSSLYWTEKALKDLSRVEGSLLLNSLTISGPLFNPVAWRFNTEGEIRDLTLVSKRLPGPLTLAKGIARADADTITFEGNGMGMLDARLNLSGRATGYIKGINSLETVIDGDIGRAALRFISDTITLPENIRLNPPVAVSEARVTWNRERGTAFKGELVVANGPRISLNGIRTPRFIKIEGLRIMDDTSDATFRFDLGQDAVGIGFAGNLTQACLDSLLIENRLLTGWIRGDLWGRIIPESPIESTIEGDLEGEDISLGQLDLPAHVDRFSLHASQQRLEFQSNILALDDRRIGLDADLDMSEQGILFKLDLSADGIDLKRVLAALEKVDRKFAGGKDPTRWSVPVKGTAQIRLNSLTYGEFEWKPFNCDISSEESIIRIAVREAALCGISTPGTVEIFPGKTGVHVLPDVKGGNLASTIDCLASDTTKMSGTFDFKGDITGKGTEETLIRSLNGPIRFVSKDGRIDRFGLLMKIFSLLNITEIFTGRLPDLRSRGFAYNSMTVDGHLEEGKFYVENALLDGSSMNIAATGHIDLLKQDLDLAVFAAPFKTVDRVLRILPVIGYILDDTLVSVAVKVTGDVENPKVAYLPVSMLGSDLLGIMKRTLKAPIKVLTPMIPK